LNRPPDAAGVPGNRTGSDGARGAPRLVPSRAR